MRVFALAAGLVVLVCGCGGATRVERGRAVFTAACAGCHTLTGHNTSAPGGDLAIAKLSTSDIASFIRVMPVHLSPAEVDAVASYVQTAATRTGR